ncbi:hypothetical protein [Rickettsia endosymbiont of Orchestes rusci]
MKKSKTPRSFRQRCCTAQIFDVIPSSRRESSLIYVMLNLVQHLLKKILK